MIAEPNLLETWPNWSPDGHYLYFCRSPRLPPQRFAEVRYDLLRIAYDLAQDRWGEVETVLSAQEAGASLAQPRVSPDGHHLLFCRIPYSSFPGTQPESDLYLMDLRTRKFRRLDVLNTPRSECWHGWSRDGRWIVFSSKRRDGLLTRPYFSYFNEREEATKPFLLPQEDPTFYDACLQFFNVPELVTGPVPVSSRALFQAVHEPRQLVKPLSEKPKRTEPAPTTEDSRMGITPYSQPRPVK